MILVGDSLRMAAGRVLEPVPDVHDPVSVDLHVEDGFTIAPRSFHVEPTEEDIDMPNDVAAMVTGRSSHMRAGVFMPGGWVDPGYQSGGDEPFVLEFFNMSDEPFMLEAGEPAARLVFNGLGAQTGGYSGRWGR